MESHEAYSRFACVFQMKPIANLQLVIRAAAGDEIAEDDLSRVADGYYFDGLPPPVLGGVERFWWPMRRVGNGGLGRGF